MEALAQSGLHGVWQPDLLPCQRARSAVAACHDECQVLHKVSLNASDCCAFAPPLLLLRLLVLADWQGMTALQPADDEHYISSAATLLSL
jgi:hypothetical protein